MRLRLRRKQQRKKSSGTQGVDKADITNKYLKQQSYLKLQSFVRYFLKHTTRDFRYTVVTCSSIPLVVLQQALHSHFNLHLYLQNFLGPEEED